MFCWALLSTHGMLGASTLPSSQTQVASLSLGHSTHTSRDKYALYVTKLMVRKVYRCTHVKSLKGRKELIKLLLPGIYIKNGRDNNSK